MLNKDICIITSNTFNTLKTLKAMVCYMAKFLDYIIREKLNKRVRVLKGTYLFDLWFNG